MFKFSKTLLSLSLLLTGIAHSAPRMSPLEEIRNELQRISTEVSAVKTQTQSNSAAINTNVQNINNLNSRVESLELENQFLRSQQQATNERMTALENLVKTLVQDPTDPTEPVFCKYDVYLQDAGPNKLNIAKLLKTALGIGLTVAVDLVNSAPVVVASNLSYEETGYLRRMIVEAGGQVSVQLIESSCQ